MHWIRKYLSIPYLDGGRDRRGLDCWGLLRLVYLEEFGIELPMLPGVSSEKTLTLADRLQREKKDSWTEIPKPVDGCGVGMSQKTVEHHVGIWAAADGGKVVHCWEPLAVQAITLRGLLLRGFRVIKFYRHNLWPT